MLEKIFTKYPRVKWNAVLVGLLLSGCGTLIKPQETGCVAPEITIKDGNSKVVYRTPSGAELIFKVHKGSPSAFESGNWNGSDANVSPIAGAEVLSSAKAELANPLGTFEITQNGQVEATGTISQLGKDVAVTCNDAVSEQ